MRDLPWRGAFDAAFCFGNSYGYLDDSGNRSFLEAVARALRPGGRFALDYGQSAESVLPRFQARVEAEIGGFRFLEENRYDVLSGRVESRYVFSRGSRSEEKLASQRMHTVSEILRALSEAGLEVHGIFGSALDEPFVLGATSLLVVAEKRAG